MKLRPVNARSMVEDQQTFQADRAALDHHGGFENVKILARAFISPLGRQLLNTCTTPWVELGTRPGG